MKPLTYNIPAGARLGDLELPPGETTAQQLAGLINASPDSKVTAQAVGSDRIEMSARQAIIVSVDLAGSHVGERAANHVDPMRRPPGAVVSLDWHLGKENEDAIYVRTKGEMLRGMTSIAKEAERPLPSLDELAMLAQSVRRPLAIARMAEWAGPAKPNCEPERRDVTGVVEYIYADVLRDEYTLFLRLDPLRVLRLVISGEHWKSALETPFADVRMTFCLYWTDSLAEPRVFGWHLPK